MDYEKKADELAEIIHRLENEKLSLSEEIELYKTAQKLYVECDEYLEKAKGDIYKIKRDLESYKEEKFISKEN